MVDSGGVAWGGLGSGWSGFAGEDKSPRGFRERTKSAEHCDTLQIENHQPVYWQTAGDREQRRIRDTEPQQRGHEALLRSFEPAAGRETRDKRHRDGRQQGYGGDAKYRFMASTCAG